MPGLLTGCRSQIRGVTYQIDSARFTYKHTQSRERSAPLTEKGGNTKTEREKGRKDKREYRERDIKKLEERKTEIKREKHPLAYTHTHTHTQMQM